MVRLTVDPSPAQLQRRADGVIDTLVGRQPGHHDEIQGLTQGFRFEVFDRREVDP